MRCLFASNSFKKLFFLSGISFLIFSCQKELSIDLGKDTTKNDCTIKSLTESDKISSDTEYAYVSSYSTLDKVLKIEFVNRTTNTVENTFLLSYQSGKVEVDANQYFLVGPDGKVTEFHGFESPDDSTSEKLTVKYTYNAAGQLIKRTEEYDLFPGIISYQMEYAYTANNLTRSEIKVNTGVTLVKFLEVVYEYDVSKPVKNFLYFHALAPEINYFQTAINAGSNSVNPLIKATTTFTDLTTGTQTKAVTNFIHYTINAEQYVKSFEVSGNDFVVAGLKAGKNYSLNYACF